MNKVRAFVVAVMVFGAIMFASTVSAQTPTTEWVNFYSSNTTLDGTPVPVGAVVTAYDPSGVLCGQKVVSQAGSYGFLACYFDDPNTSENEGITTGDKVTFRINGSAAGEFQLPSSIQNGDRFEVNLAAGARLSRPKQIPEPATIALLGGGAAGLAAYLRKRRGASEEEEDVIE